MSNRYMARIYNGDPSVRGGGGGNTDLFGIQFHRQQQLLQQQHQQELEKMREAERLEEQEATKETELGKTKTSFDAAVDILQKRGMIPNDKNIQSYDDATTQEKLLIAQTENDIENVKAQNEKTTLQSKPGQDAMTQANMALLAKPALENNIMRGQAQGLSRIDYPPNTGVGYNPGGDFTKPPVFGQGPSQSIHMVGGITDPKTGQLIGARPVETYGPASFPPVAKIDVPWQGSGGGQVQVKPPTDMFGNPQGQGSPFVTPNEQPTLPNGLPIGAQPPVGANQVMTKPSGPVDFNARNVGSGASLAPWIQWLMQQSQGQQGSPYGLH